MSRVRKGALLAIAVSVALSSSGSARAAAARPPTIVPASLTAQVVSAHFVVHYASDPSDPNAITVAQAQTVSSTAEHAYAYETGPLGFPPPLDDGDGLIDVYVYDDPQRTENGVAHRDSPADTSSGWITINPHGTGIENATTIPHELFHLIQLGLSSRLSSWDLEGGATWASARVAGTLSNHSPVYLLSPPHQNEPLDCPGTPCSSPTPIDAYRDWPFIEFLQERFGADTYLSVLRRAAALVAADRAAGLASPNSHDLQSFNDVLLARGGSLATGIGGWAAASLVGQYSYGPLAGRSALVAPSASALRVGAPPQVSQLAVNHLSTFYLSTGTFAACSCRPTLHVRVTAAGGALSTALALGPSLVTPSAGVPNGFDVLDPSLQPGRIAVTNPATSPDNVRVTVAVWATSPAVPAVKVLRLKVNHHRRTSIRLVVASSAAGSLTLRLSSATRTVGLHPGRNQAVLTLPRHLRARRPLLTLIPRAADGRQGAPLHRRVALRSR